MLNDKVVEEETFENEGEESVMGTQQLRLRKSYKRKLFSPNANEVIDA